MCCGRAVGTFALLRIVCTSTDSHPRMLGGYVSAPVFAVVMSGVAAETSVVCRGVVYVDGSGLQGWTVMRRLQ